MSELVVRRLLIDLETPFERHWCGGDAFRTALFNALSLSFPVGEQFFIDAVREGLKVLPADRQSSLRAEVQGFIGQEATHRRIHGLFNGHLERQGLINHWHTRVLRRLKFFDRMRSKGKLDARHPLAITAANEHFTAILADWLLSNPHALDGAEPRLRTMWLWHCAEEAEHKTTAFDLYVALGGTNEWRLRWFRRITLFFLTDVMRQTVNNLYRDGTLWRWSTWKSGARFLFGERGLVRQTYGAWRDYKRPDFHPSQHDNDLSRQWLAANSASFTPVGAAAV